MWTLPWRKSESDLERKCQTLTIELSQALQQQAVTSQILGMIASSPTELQPVLDAVAENAARLCEANNAVIYRTDGEVLWPVAVHGTMPPAPAGTPVNRRTVVGRVIVDQQISHINDLAAEVDTEFPDSKAISGCRYSYEPCDSIFTRGISIGAIHVRRSDVPRTFTDEQIKLLKTFADQALIAIENARVFQERETRNRELSALHDVTAAATQSLEIKPVLEEVVKRITEIFNFDSVRIF